MTATVIPPVSKVSDERAIGVLTLAFSADPIVRWFYPDSHQYLSHFPSLVRDFGGKAFALDTAVVAEDYAGAALWLPPGVSPDEEPLVDLVKRTVAQAQQASAFEFLDQQAAYHPHEPHWYLPLIGVDPARQGQGHGSRLLRSVLNRCDREGIPAYLEATSAGGRRLYERHGFEVVGTIQVADSPPMWPMWRTPR